MMQDTWHLTQEQVAAELGLTRDHVAQALRILSFPFEVQKLVSEDTITQTHAEALARLAGNPTVLKEAITSVIDGNMDTNATELLVRDIIEREQLLKDIRKYVGSEEFMLALSYLLPLSPAEESTMCPMCYFTGVEYDEEECRKKCKRCGWNDEQPSDRLWELARRIKRRFLKKRGLKPYWEEHNA